MFLPLTVSEEHETVLARLEEEQQLTLIKNCVHAIIVLSQERAPIKRVDLNKLVFSSVSTRSVPQAILHAANCELNKTFGMRLYEIEDKSKLLLVNTKTEFAKFQNHSDAMCEELTVLYFILLDIFAAPDERKNEDDLLDTMSSLDHDQETLKSYIDSFVKLLYLTMTKEHDSKFYSWGPRALAEIDPENFFIKFLELAGDSTDKDWPEKKQIISQLCQRP